jgi:hypothetical protein
MVRPGADRRTQQCLRCKRGDCLECDMFEANRVRPHRSRGWYCKHCALYLNPRLEGGERGSPVPERETVTGRSRGSIPCVAIPGSPSHHEPTPYALEDTFSGGVRCSCGEDFSLGRPFPDTPAGKPSRRKLRTMTHCWDAWRVHAWPPR